MVKSRVAGSKCVIIFCTMRKELRFILRRTAFSIWKMKGSGFFNRNLLKPYIFLHTWDTLRNILSSSFSFSSWASRAEAAPWNTTRKFRPNITQKKSNRYLSRAVAPEGGQHPRLLRRPQEGPPDADGAEVVVAVLGGQLDRVLRGRKKGQIEGNV